MWGKSFVPSLQQPHLGKLSHQLRGASWPEPSIASISPVSIFLDLPRWHCLILCADVAPILIASSTHGQAACCSPCAAVPAEPITQLMFWVPLSAPQHQSLLPLRQPPNTHKAFVCLRHWMIQSDGAEAAAAYTSPPSPEFLVSLHLSVNKVTFSSQPGWLINNKPIQSPSDSFTSASFWRETSKKWSLNASMLHLQLFLYHSRTSTAFALCLFEYVHK